MTVGVVTDSAAALPRELARELGVVVVPMWVTIGGRAFREDELSLEEVARTEEPITTSAPSPGLIRAAIEEACGPDGALVCTVARRLSAVHDAARLAAEPFGERVRVLDTGTAAGAEARASRYSPLRTSQVGSGSSARFTRRLARAAVSDDRIEPGKVVSTARNRMTSSSPGVSWRAAKSPADPVTASSGSQPTPAALGMSRNSSVWTRSSRAVHSARSR